MSTRRRLISISVALGALIAVIYCDLCCLEAANAYQGDEYNCNTSCGKLRNISYPFHLKGDRRTNCGDPRYELACENNRTILILYSGKYFVEEISYLNRTIQIVDPGLEKDNCSSMPLYSLNTKNFSYDDPYSLSHGFRGYMTVFMECSAPIIADSPEFGYYLETSPCFNGSVASTAFLHKHSYVLTGGGFITDVQDSCSIGMVVPISLRNLKEMEEVRIRSFSDIHHEMVKGFELSWHRIDCGFCDGRSDNCYPDSDDQGFIQFFRDYTYLVEAEIYRALKIIGFIMAARTFFGIIILSPFVINKFRRRHFSIDNDIEQFLQGHVNLMPIRYSYSDIKMMTKCFEDKLGQGGFGSVFKGKLRSSHQVAVKMLVTSKGNGQDFINEVATIGRIHHVNVVQLVGFCAEGSKRALVYDFMPNGSLDKYLFPQEEENVSLTWEKMHKIALGVAHGIEYLHQGCDMQILHFDIKPNNILLDENFTPKVSDFGLARLYPTDDSIVSLTAARGTIGYIAPEMFYKKFGGVSHKADVYSFGMLLMEMAGRRKNINAHVDNSSQIYFPSWIYDQLDRGENMDIGDATEDQKNIAKKMIVVALWCIQMKPVDRPSMNRVIEMLQGPVELLQMPPKPFISSPERVLEDPSTKELTTISHSSSLSWNSME